MVGGFAFEVNDLGFLYGYENGGRVLALGLGLVGGGLDPRGAVAVARVGERFGLRFVDWLGLRAFSASDVNALSAWVAAATAEHPGAAT